MEAFSALDIYKNILDLDRLECKLQILQSKSQASKKLQR